MTIKQNLTEISGNEFALRELALQSFTAIANFLKNIQGKEEMIKSVFSLDAKGNYSTLNLETHVPLANGIHTNMAVSFQPQLGGGTLLMKRGDGTYEIILFVPYDPHGSWNRDFVPNIYRWFVRKRGSYAIEFTRVERIRRTVPRTHNQHQTSSRRKRKAAYSTEDIRKTVEQLSVEIKEKVQTLNKSQFRKEFGWTARGFIHSVADNYLGKEFMDAVNTANKTYLFKVLYDLYVEVKELMKMKETPEQLLERIETELMALCEEVVDAEMNNLDAKVKTGEWKDINDLEKEVDHVPAEDKGSSNDLDPQATLDDLMGMGGDEVLVDPEDHLPAKESDTDLTQLDEEVARLEEMLKKNENKNFFNQYFFDAGFRLR